MHDAWRVDPRGKGTFDKVLNAARLLQRHQVEFNILTEIFDEWVARDVGSMFVIAGILLIVGLIATTDRIAQVRQNRLLGQTQEFRGDDYVDRAQISEELKYARAICARNNWPIIDVTRRSIEETAAAIVALVQKRD